LEEQEQQQQYNLSITFRGSPVAEEFNDIMGYQVGATVIAVMLKDGTTYIYPVDTVESVIHSLA
jgi:phosphosulfolactate phosphohydrolase-like enzyme